MFSDNPFQKHIARKKDGIIMVAGKKDCSYLTKELFEDFNVLNINHLYLKTTCNCPL